MPPVYLDIETRKVPTHGFIMPNGEPMRMRWQPFLVGLARVRPYDGGYDYHVLTLHDEDKHGEAAMYARVAECLYMWECTEIVYSATRQFDEMVLKGRFTNARRAHLPAPGPWPRMLAARFYPWRCLRPATYPRPPGGIQSKNVPAAWERGHHAIVLRHLTEDLTRLIELDRA